jgi:hypothetical protein
MTTTSTCEAPARFKARAAAPQVAPVVRISSTNSTVRPARPVRARAQKASRIKRARSVLPACARRGVAESRRSNRLRRSESRVATACAKASAWLYPLAHCRRQWRGTGVTHALSDTVRSSGRASIRTSTSQGASQASCSCLSRKQRSRMGPWYGPKAIAPSNPRARPRHSEHPPD